jgi:hypothetical protein
MIDRTARRFGITPRHLAADSAYGSAANLAWLVKERQIEPHIPVLDKSSRTDGTFSRSDLVFDAERNHYTSPQGKLLVQFRRTFATPRSGITKQGARLYRSSKSDCQGCAFKPKCCPNTPQRKVPRDLDEDARDVARSLANTHRPSSVRVIAGRRSRCSSLTSNASCGSAASDCAVRAARETSSYSQPRRRT